MATFVMQALGCDVAAINTVNFSNHTGYRRFQGTRATAEEITNLWNGLKSSYLTDFSVLLSGYCPSAAVVNAVGVIARELRLRSELSPGDFFWVLDPVMGDQGKLYVAEEEVDAYGQLAGQADLVLPNQFELELLAGLEVGSIGKGGMKSCVEAMGKLHATGVSHIVVTSIRVEGQGEDELQVVGSSVNSKGEGRYFVVKVPKLDCFFSGTGDMFAGLMVARLREECEQQGTLRQRAWMSDDGVGPADLPLARATEKVLSSMQMVLEKTMTARDEQMAHFGQSPGASIGGLDGDQISTEEDRRYLAQTQAAEVRVVRNQKDLLEPDERYKAEAV
ncbi:pyridoxal kinase [Cyphellophora europaea CBS 101466]|uniref:pyridoxal kinase n=1 Tax=Cyphellophora europaea (strain CBS 101466) TaxID=1220924 RepID=W2S4I7_CYPE1|nr:pyridoxal kinase [Cyphellophora europaea CBS 101466]ETN43505.1 pyridoxal kinase [Cyphellophora europaea CBS 101466]